MPRSDFLWLQERKKGNEARFCFSAQPRAMSTLFNQTKKFKEGADAYCSFELDVIKQLLERLASGQGIDRDSADENIVLARDWLQHVVDRAGAQQARIEDLQRELQAFVDDDRLILLLKYYQVSLKKLLAEQERSPVTPYHLDDVQWRLDLQLASNDLNKVLQPSALLNFELSPSDQNEKVCLH
jgi:hypothetical protein